MGLKGSLHSPCTFLATIFLVTFILRGGACSWPAPPIYNVVCFANASQLIIIGTVTSRSEPAPIEGEETYYNATVEAERVLKGSCDTTITVRARVMPERSPKYNPEALVGDRVFLLLFEYSSNSFEKSYSLGLTDYIWVINDGLVYNRWERHQKETLRAPKEVTGSYGWTYSLAEFLDLVRTAIKDPERADPTSLKPIPSTLVSSVTITLLIILPSMFVTAIAVHAKRKTSNTPPAMRT